jgi:hypothetical protein
MRRRHAPHSEYVAAFRISVDSATETERTDSVFVMRNALQWLQIGSGFSPLVRNDLVHLGRDSVTDVLIEMLNSRLAVSANAGTLSLNQNSLLASPSKVLCSCRLKWYPEHYRANIC